MIHTCTRHGTWRLCLQNFSQIGFFISVSWFMLMLWNIPLSSIVHVRFSEFYACLSTSCFGHLLKFLLSNPIEKKDILSNARWPTVHVLSSNISNDYSYYWCTLLIYTATVDYFLLDSLSSFPQDPPIADNIIIIINRFFHSFVFTLSWTGMGWIQILFPEQLERNVAWIGQQSIAGHHLSTHLQHTEMFRMANLPPGMIFMR